MKVCVLGSGSQGNCVWIEGGGDAVMVDNGFSGVQLTRRLEERGLELGRLRGVCVTHEHSDHVKGLKVLHRLCGEAKFYANGETARRVSASTEVEEGAWRTLPEANSPFEVGALRVTGFRVPHDAVNPWGYVVEHGGSRVGVATDLGQPVMPVKAMLKGCDLVVLEANHDVEMLRHARRPWRLKQRILGNQGHLSNEAAAGLVGELAAGGRLKRVVLAHLSGECNCEELAVGAVLGRLEAMGLTETVEVRVARQGEPTVVWEI